jgi:hypothetical protein
VQNCLCGSSRDSAGRLSGCSHASSVAVLWNENTRVSCHSARPTLCLLLLLGQLASTDNNVMRDDCRMQQTQRLRTKTFSAQFAHGDSCCPPVPEPKTALRTCDWLRGPPPSRPLPFEHTPISPSQRWMRTLSSSRGRTTPTTRGISSSGIPTAACHQTTSGVGDMG